MCFPGARPVRVAAWAAMGVAALLLLGATAASAAAAQGSAVVAPAIFSVYAFGARGDGSQNDTSAV